MDKLEEQGRVIPEQSYHKRKEQKYSGSNMELKVLEMLGLETMAQNSLKTRFNLRWKNLIHQLVMKKGLTVTKPY